MADSSTQKEVIQGVLSRLDDKLLHELYNWCTADDDEMVRKLLNLSTKQPKTFSIIAFDSLREEPILDYITDLEVRERILFRFRTILQKVESNFQIDMAFIATIMVAPIDALQSRLHALNTSIRNNDLDVVHEFFSACEETVLPSILGYVNKGGRRSTSQPNSAKISSKSSSIQASPAKRPRVSHGRSLSYPNPQIQPLTPLRPRTLPPPATPPQPASPLPIRVPTDASPTLPVPQRPSIAGSSSGRNPIATQLCKRRDNFKCLLSGYQNPEGAHIIPFAATRNPQTLKLILDLVRMFWGDDVADMLSTLLQDRGITESPQNFLSLNHQLHWWFDSAKMAFKPLRKLSDGSIVVQLYWLEAGRLRPSQACDESDFEDVLIKAGLQRKTWGRMLAHRKSGLRLETGQVFTFKADIPEHIPNFALLQLSWDLLRIIAMCGAAEEEDIDDDDVVDDDGFGLEASQGLYEEDSGAQIYQWAVDVEMEEAGAVAVAEAEEEENKEEEGEKKDEKSEQTEEEKSVEGAKSPC